MMPTGVIVVKCALGVAFIVLASYLVFKYFSCDSHAFYVHMRMICIGRLCSSYPEMSRNAPFPLPDIVLEQKL